MAQDPWYFNMCSYLLNSAVLKYITLVYKSSLTTGGLLHDATGAMVTDKPAPALNATLSIISARIIHNKIITSTLQYLISAQRQSLNLKTYSN